MLKITRLRAANPESYYLEVIARGAEEYYVRGNQIAGRWIGTGSPELGLEGAVRAADLRAVLQHRHPHTGEKLPARRLRRVGFDLTLSAPKSVSLLWALGSREQSSAALASHRAAVDATVEYLERHVCQVRRGGHDGYDIETQRGSGLIGAGFLHFTSRAADPQVHTHLVTANMAKGPDGRYTALHGNALWEHRRAAGYLYQAVLRHELHARLGLGFTAVEKGSADIIGLSLTRLRLFSRRRIAIERELERTGGSGERASQVASVKTRQPKDLDLDLNDLRQQWRERGAPIAVDLQHLPMRRQRTDLPSDLQLAAAIVADRATFTVPDLTATVASLCPYGASLDDIEDRVQSFLTSPLAVDVGRSRWTTTEILELEQRSVDTARRRQHQGLATVDDDVLTRALAERPSLSREQRRMVVDLCTQGSGVDIVVGVPGSGKTFALGAARIAWHAAGYDVIGCALAARTAAGLEADSGIASETIRRTLGDIDSGYLTLTDRTVVVCDEASMVGTRDLSTLIDLTARTGAKLVLVGDPKQLPPIEAGGLYPALERRLGATTLTQNRRQRDRDERHIVHDLRHGHTERAVARLQRTGRLTTGSDPDKVLDQMVADWMAARAAGADATMIALTHDAVAELNARAREQLAASGQLGEAVAVIEDTGTEFADGDTVVCLRIDRRMGVRNGDVATVLGSTDSGLTIDRDGTQIEVPGRYLAAGHLTHGYALTAHKAQGATYDQALLFGDEHLYAEAGYTSLTRGRERNAVYVVAEDGSVDVRQHLERRFARRGLEKAAIELGRIP